MLRRLVWAQARTQRAREGNSGRQETSLPLPSYNLQYICKYICICIHTHTYTHARMHACTTWQGEGRWTKAISIFSKSISDLCS